MKAARVTVAVVTILVAAQLAAASGERSLGFDPAYAQGEENLGQASHPPNIVLIVMDDMRYDDVHFMPHTEQRVGIAEFTNAWVSDSLCCPSRATLLTGQYVWNHGVKGNWDTEKGANYRDYEAAWINRDDTSLASWLDSYYTYGDGKLFNFYDPHDSEKDFNPSPPWDEEYFGTTTDERIFDRAITEVNNHDFSTPLFMYLAPHTPHPPGNQWQKANNPVRDYRKLYSLEKVPRTSAFNEECPSSSMSDKPKWLKNKKCIPFSNSNGIPPPYDSIEEMDELYRDRARSLRFVDDKIDQLLGALVNRNQLSKTYVIFTADQGFHMGDHRLFPLKDTPYIQDVRLPLLVRGPDVISQTNTNLVSNNDIAPTIRAMADGILPSGYKLDGRSLLPLLADALSSNGRKRLAIAKYDGPAGSNTAPLYRAMVFSTGELYVRYLNDNDSYDPDFTDAYGQYEFYDSDDPWEIRNKYGSLTKAQKDAYDAQLDSILGCAGNNPSLASDCKDPENLN